MYRTILELGPFRIQSYGLMLALAFLAGGILLLRAARRRSLDEGQMINLIYIIVISSVVGSRLMYVVTHWEDYSGEPLEVLKIWEGGLTLYGGLILAVAASVIYMKRAGLAIWVVCDLAAPSVALGKVFTRIGCFLNGCCFGVESHVPWALEFPASCQAGSTFPGAALHPTQLYSAGLSLVIFTVLIFLGRRDLRAGTVFWSFMLLDSVGRFGLGFLRYTEPAGRGLEIAGVAVNLNQLLALLIAAVSLGALARLRS